MYGFYGKLLKVNLTEQETSVEEISPEVFKNYLGGKGLGSYLLLKHLPSGVEPLSPENKVIFTTGNATGTNMWGSSRYGVYTRSPLTGLYSESYSGGKAPQEIKKTGYDAIVLEGKAKKPLYLEISDEKVAFHDASHIWGADAHFSEDCILKEVGVSGAQAVVIGQAGEKQVRFAGIQNNYWHSAGRTGVGTVLGSKNLKGIAFYGKSRAEIANPNMLKEYVKELKDASKDLPAVKAYKNYGTTMMVSMMNEANCFPTKYWSKNHLDTYQNICGETFIQTQDVRPSACPYCMMACGNMVTVKSGEHAGLKLEGPEYETIYAFGGLCCIDRMDDIIYLNDLCDKLGMDTISAGNLVALTMEASERGMIDYNLPYGDTKGAALLLHKIVNREGLGGILAEGIKAASEQLGLSDLAIHVKGLEPAGYDPRKLKGVGLGYATSARGACHLRATFYKPEVAGMIDPSVTEGKAQFYIDFEDRLTIFNTQILCVFFRDLIQWPNLITLVEATTGVKYSEEELRKIANDIIGLTRQFNVNNGAGRKDDKLPRRFYEEPHDNVENNLTEEDLEKMLSDYYSIRGWSNEGRPLNLSY